MQISLPCQRLFYQRLLYAFFPIFIGSLATSAVNAQALNPTQSGLPKPPHSIQPLPLPQDVTPPNPSLPTLPVSPTPSEEVLPSPQSPSAPAEIPDAEETMAIAGFRVSGNTIFSEETLRSIPIDFNQSCPSSNGLPQKSLSIPKSLPSIDQLAGQTLTFSQLFSIACKVAEFYAGKGYSTSGAVISIPEDTQKNQKGFVTIQVIEGELEDITVVTTGSHRLHQSYVRSRLGVEVAKPLNVARLQEHLQILQLDPLIDRISAQLSAGSRPGSTILTVAVEAAQSFSALPRIDNSRAPSVGSFQRQGTISEANLLGLGDSLSASYTNTDGSHGLTVGYSLPLNADNGALSLEFNTTDSHVIEPPFDRLDISSTAQSYEVTLRQPIMQSVKAGTFQELALGLTASLQNTRTFLLGEPYQFSLGTDRQGRTRIFALRFSQDWLLRDARQVFALRSRFSFGLDALNSTINDPIPGISIPDSRFFSWQGQAQYVRLLAPETLLVVRANAQLAGNPLLSAEEFAIGGAGSVRGYRQDALLADNGIFASAEIRVPILRIPRWQSTIQLIPFIDYGTLWNSPGGTNLNPDTLASVGLGLQWLLSDRLSARLDYGIPLVDIGSRNRTWQESGLYFSVQYSPF